MSKCQWDILSLPCTALHAIAHNCHGLWYQGCEAILGIIENIKTGYSHKFSVVLKLKFIWEEGVVLNVKLNIFHQAWPQSTTYHHASILKSHIISYEIWARESAERMAWRFKQERCRLRALDKLMTMTEGQWLEIAIPWAPDGAKKYTSHFI